MQHVLVFGPSSEGDFRRSDVRDACQQSDDDDAPDMYTFVVALWEVFYIENKRFDSGTFRVPSRSPTPISKSNDVLGQSDDIWGARGPHFRSMLGVPRAGQRKY